MSYPPPQSILPLPAPIGMDMGSVIHQPQYLRIEPSHPSNHPTNMGVITDSYGRETISAHFIKRTQTDFSLPGQGGLLFRLRPYESGLTRFFSDGHVYILEDARGTDIATFAPYQSGGIRGVNNRHYVIDCLNGISGAHAQITLRGSFANTECALMLGTNPVALVRRPVYMDYWGYTGASQDPYHALIAPGTDLLWVSTILRCLDILYYRAVARP